MRLMRRIALLVFVLVLVPTGVAQAGGWATVELDRAPSGIAAGQPWRVELIIKQHGVTPLNDARPTLRIDNGNGVVRTFRASRVGPGRYAASVTYPSAGTWQTRIFDGWTDASPHRLAPIAVAAGYGSPGGFPWAQVIAIVAVALLWTGGVIAGFGWPHPRRRLRSAFHVRPPRAA
jgi:hypothetical protein